MHANAVTSSQKYFSRTTIVAAPKQFSGFASSLTRYTRRCLIILGLTPLLLACTTAATKIVKQADLLQEMVDTGTFQLTIYRNRLKSNQLHVYLSGDGTPWIRGIWAAQDPSPRNPLALKLLTQDSHAAILLSRPCFDMILEQPACEYNLWTDGRYSATVIDSMVVALKQLLAAEHFTGVTLIGFSGGGSIATLIAEHIPEVTQVVTVSANLDTRLWTTTMKYSPLIGSLNPTDLSTVRQDVYRLHLIGKQDTTVPPAVTESFAAKHGGEIRYFDQFSHHCCWQRVWPQILKDIDTNATSR